MKCPTCYLTQGPLGLIVILFAAVILIRAVVGGSVAPKPPMFQDHLTLQQAVDRSSESGKPIFAFATADWCGPCQAFKRGALSDQEVVAAALSGTEPVYIDIDKDVDARQRLASFAGQNDIYSVPTIMLIRNGEVIAYHEGGLSAAAMLQWLQLGEDG